MAFTALLDACVLVPAALRDTLLRAAERYMYRAIWSSEILSEVGRALEEDLDKDPERVGNLLSELEAAFPDALVTGYEHLVESMTVDAGDRHVAAAAVIGHAQVLITNNRRDFPQSSLDPYNIEVQTHDEFLENLFDLDPEGMVEIIIQQASDLGAPPLTPREVCANLRRQFAPRFADLIEARFDADDEA